MIISISPWGNLGNKMIEYMAALALARQIGESITYNCDLAEWGISFDKELHDRLLSDGPGTLVIRDIDATSVLDLANMIRSSGKQAVVFEGFFQRLELFHDADFYKYDVFPADHSENIDFRDNEIVINVRAGEILNGVTWYPLIPVSFYRSLVDAMGFEPVFLGQLDDCAYVRAIRDAFPSARMIPSAGAMIDFNRLRHAKRICIAVSTFSWLAGWLSDAVEIHYPLLGFLHPASFRKGRHGLGGIDLAPVNDPRYRFHLFPVISGEAETEYLDFVSRIKPISKAVPRSLVRVLKTSSPILVRTFPDEALDLNETWYLKHYIDAAWEISEGWYHDARHHYTEVGKLRGYLPHKPLYKPQSKNVAFGKLATQSSLSAWSIFSTVEQDASSALDGVIDGRQSFHTDIEDSPWWRVNLGTVFWVSEVRIFNRMEHLALANRASRLAIDIGLEETDLVEVYRRLTDEPFGGIDGNPLIFKPTTPILGRFVRIRLLTRNYLHFDQVEVYGEAMPTLSYQEAV